MKRNSFKKILAFVLVLAAVVLPVLGNPASYKATEATGEASGTQGVITAANYYDYSFSPYQDIIVWASEDSTASLLSITGQPEGTFAWFYNFVLEYNEENGTWVVTKADMSMTDSANQSEKELLGPNKMVVMFHDLVVDQQKDSYNFFLETVEVGKEYYLGVHPSAIFEVYDKVDGVFLSTEPVEVEAPETESEEEKETTSEDKSENNAGTTDGKNPVSPLVIATVVVVIIAVVGIVVVVVKRKK